MAKPVGYTGYYPGEKIPRTPGGRPKPYTPNEYDLDALSETIDSATANFGNIPDFVRDNLDAGMKRAFKANIFANHLDTSELTPYTEGELAEERGELAGVAGFSINLDPREIIKDPNKWLSKIPSQTWQELKDWKDLNLKYRQQYWADLLGLKVLPNGKRRLDYRAVEALQTKEIFVAARDTLPGGRDSLQIAGLTRADGTEVSFGTDTAQAIADFEGDIKSVFFRPANYDKILRTAGKETAGILRNTIENGTITGSSSTVGHDLDMALAFIAYNDLASSVKGVAGTLGTSYRGSATGSGLEDVIARLNEERSPIASKLKDGQEVPLDLGKTMEGIREEIEKSRAQMSLMSEGVGSLTARQRTLLGKDTVEFFENLPPGALLDRISKSERRRLEKYMARYEKSLKRLENALDKPTPTTVLGRQKLLRDVSAASTDLIKGQYLEPAIERAVLQEVERMLTGRGLSREELRRLESMLTPGSPEQLYVRNLRIILPTVTRDLHFYSMDDLVDAFYGDKVLSAYLWVARINPRLKAFTPDYYIDRFMTRMNYFGLVIKEHDSLIDIHGNELDPKFFLYRWSNKFIKNNKIFQNSFKINLKGLGIKIKVSGGSHFAVVSELKELMESNPDLLTNLLANPADAFNILNGVLGDADKAKALAEKFQKFHKWLEDNRLRLGELGVNIRNADHIKDLMKALLRYDADKIKNLGIGITTQFRGTMQWFTQKLSIAQNAIFKSAIGKAAGVIIGWKTAASHAISAAIISAITAATGGIGSVSAVFEKILQFIIRVILDTLEKVAAAIFQGDLEVFFKFTEKSIYNLLKWLSYGMGLVGIFFFICMIPIMVILGAISPQDNSKIGATGSGSGSPGSPGIPVDPIFGEDCEATLACITMQALLQNNFERVVNTNIDSANEVIRTLISEYPHFEVARFIRVMDYNTRRFDAFQCIGYSIAADPDLTTSPTWSMLYNGTQPGCRRVTPESAGLDDHIVFPLRNGHYHIGVLVAVREDGSAMMYDVNYDGNGSLHQWPIMNLVEFTAGNNSRNPGEELTVLRCP